MSALLLQKSGPGPLELFTFPSGKAAEALAGDFFQDGIDGIVHARLGRLGLFRTDDLELPLGVLALEVASSALPGLRETRLPYR